ncbi:glycoside hydrolase family 38 C-terminal domain-containing protein [Isoptericola hypogeus]|uniref:Glycoside hydrolase family 38 C-terminal domain-containing protein n=1 Tax=Isoptericola hypogeus TaxID=300179 RepID=A0ABN2J4T7_9MICO
MHSTTTRTQARVTRVVRDRIAPFVHRPVAEVGLQAWPVDGGQGEPVPAAHALGLRAAPGRETPDYRPFAVGHEWGPAWGTTWFRITGTVPAGLADGERAELVVDLGWEDHSVGFQCEGLVMTADGAVLKALNPRNRWVDLTAVAGPGESFELYLEAASNPLLLDVPPFRPVTGGEKETAGPAPAYRLRRAEICVLERELHELVLDLEVSAGVAAELSVDEPRHHRLLRAVDRALDEIDPEDLAASGARARTHLREVLARPAHATAHRATAVGHAHIDSAWLWPVRETARKVTRTVANTLSLMDEHDDFVYAMSSAQQFAWIEEHAPEVFARVVERVREGRFVPVGGMWVESDVTMPSGESLVRQILHGQRYMRERFGAYNRILWLPDSFGYSGALPQLARLGGFDSFLTQKISWNDTNDFPHHTFWWEGIDGTRLLTHFPPVDTYGAEVTPRELAHAVRNFRDKELSDHSLVPFGYGDGGGGPTREMLGRVERMADLEGVARVEQRRPDEFFADLHAETTSETPVWRGELALELHRATFTTQVAMKQGNRRSENLLREVEARAVRAMLAGAPYPYDELASLWQRVLLHQFHDILPGTSISWVHREARATYAAVEAEARALADAADAAVAAAEPAAVEPAAVEPATPTAEVRVDADARTVESADVSLRLDAGGAVVSWVDAATGREVVPAGARLGELRLLRDQPVLWDAWDVDRGARRTAQALDGPCEWEVVRSAGRAGLAVTRSFGRSVVRTSYALVPGRREVEVEVDVDWHESERLLTVGFPVDVAARTARFETQFGYVERAVHENTSWDWAQYETCAHRYVHVSEPGFGVAVVNDGSYGHEVAARDGGGVEVAASVVRAPHYPDPATDQGRHRKRWVLAVADDLGIVTETAARVNRVLAPVDSPVGLEVDEGVAVLDTVKAAEDRSGDVVVRLYEAAGGRARARLVPGPLLGADVSVRVVDLLEDDLGADLADDRSLVSGQGAVAVELRPFQVLTLRLSRTRAGDAPGAPRPH